MYRVINMHMQQVLDAIDFERHVCPYIWLKEQFLKVDVSADPVFQKQFRRYWQLNAARLSEPFLGCYFRLLQELKGTNEVSVEAVTRKLHLTPTHGSGRQSLQFSFSTKLVHTLCPHAPIYDSMIEAFYFLPAGSPNETFDQKLQRLSRAYGFLGNEYQRILRNSLLSEALIGFRKRHDHGHVFSDEKIVDTLIWNFVTLLRRGAIVDARVTYG